MLQRVVLGLLLACLLGVLSSCAGGSGCPSGGTSCLGGGAGGGSGGGGGGGVRTDAGQVDGGAARDAGLSRPDAGVATTDAGQTCTGTTGLCGTTCVDLVADPANCGVCGKVCGPGQVCSKGLCGALPDDCVAAGGCAEGYFCDPSAKRCLPGCRLPTECPMGSVCSAGANVCACPASQHFCGQTCVSDTSPLSCGSACLSCPVVPHAAATCSGRCSFTCDQGYERVGDRCAQIVGWSPLASANSPSARSGHAMAYDERRDRVVLFGGLDASDAGTLNDTWEFDGLTWARSTPLHAPSRRQNSGLAYDPLSQKVVLYSGTRPLAAGRDAGLGEATLEQIGDTWEWDGTDWTQRLPEAVTVPFFDGRPSLTFDPSRMKLVAANDTSLLEWSGSQWTVVTDVTAFEDGVLVFGPTDALFVIMRTVTSSDVGETNVRKCVARSCSTLKINTPLTPVRAFATIAYHPGLGPLVLFGGRTAKYSRDRYNSDLSDTWAWDGRDWLQLSPRGVPPAPRRAAAMAYDSKRARLVLFGGRTPDSFFDDTWAFQAK